jgi:tetratricopeptide (TPR) repeat protein
LIAVPDEAVLQSLEDAELLVRDRDRPGVWRFRHEMLRDVAYETLAKSERLRLHLLVADGLSAQDAERYRGPIAYHLEQAALASLDLSPADRSLPDRAVEALSKAGDRARRGIESRAAIDLYRRALALAGPEDRWGKREAWILSGMGEAKYWLGEFQDAERDLTRALELGGDDQWTKAHASRFLADIMLSVRGEPERAHELFEQALQAARELNDDWVMARTLLTAAWEPYWRDDIDGARKMFEEALDVARKNPERDPWSEARALTSLSSVISPVSDEAECLDLAERALALGREMGDAFTVAVAQERIGTSLQRMFRLDHALTALSDAARAYEDLDARWELASALGERAYVLRYMGRPHDGERDAERALSILLAIRERSLIAWTVTMYALSIFAQGDLDRAKRVLHEYAEELSSDEVGTKAYLRRAQTMIALADGDRDRALGHALMALDEERAAGWPNPTAAATWWVGRLFGAEHVGGDEELERARARLEAVHWISSIKEPELVPAARA